MQQLVYDTGGQRLDGSDLLGREIAQSGRGSTQLADPNSFTIRTQLGDCWTHRAQPQPLAQALRFVRGQGFRAFDLDLSGGQIEWAVLLQVVEVEQLDRWQRAHASIDVARHGDVDHQ